jgi:hypothetical protein
VPAGECQGTGCSRQKPGVAAGTRWSLCIGRARAQQHSQVLDHRRVEHVVEVPCNIVRAGRCDVYDGRMVEIELPGDAKAPGDVDGGGQPQHPVAVRHVHHDVGDLLLQHVHILTEYVPPDVRGNEDCRAERRFIAADPERVNDATRAHAVCDQYDPLVAHGGGGPRQQLVQVADALLEVDRIPCIREVRTRRPREQQHFAVEPEAML